MALSQLHPAVANWFGAHFPAPTPAQAQAWPAIAQRRATLIAAPTGSGKTLAAFLAAIDDLVRQGLADGGLRDETQIVYVSPLKALSNDIERNLQQPLAGIRVELEKLGLADLAIRAQVRTGDTPAAERVAMRKHPPHILVTTPESLYLLLTSESGRALLATTRSVIVDEIHALAGNKRGAHLSLSLERLAALCARPPTRIGISATQKPLHEIAEFLTGAGGDTAPPVIVDAGHQRPRDLALSLPDAPLEAVMSNEVWEQIYRQLAALIAAHRTTLIFVNTRRMAERVVRHLSDLVGREFITSHHGSLSKEQRLGAEQALKAGKLKALVATASLELGIDIGDVDLVCQLGTPRGINTFLQRVGRANHAVTGTPKGRLFPLSRDELVECIALLRAVRAGELDRLRIPAQPLDVLAQQLVAETASRECGEDELFALVRRARPYWQLTRSEFDAVIRMLADGFSTRRGRRSAYIHRDAVNKRVTGRRGARLTALTCGGAIPDHADYQVILEPSQTFVGTLNEDFAIESMAGDIFQLGNMSYRIQRIESGVVRVEDAHGQPPSIPFWLGESNARSDELSQAVSQLRADIDAQLTAIDAPTINAAIAWLQHAVAIDELAARQAVEYLAATKAVLGLVPTQEQIVFERFFDESGGMQFIIHAPFGSRINRAWGLSLRKRFCRQFNFELQAAATEDSIVLSLGETHSFPLADVARYLHSNSAREVLIQAMLDAPLFEVRWRWNATNALAIRRRRNGAKNPAPLQRMEAQDLISLVFPDQIACAENLAGAREVPDHPLVNQTVNDCLHEAMDVDGFVALLAALERGEKTITACDLPAPSPLAQEILNAKPYAFLDDAPLEERRTQAVMSRRWLDPVAAGEFGKLDPAAIAQVRAEAWPAPESGDELHDALLSLTFIGSAEVAAHGWSTLMQALRDAGRAAIFSLNGVTTYVATELVALFQLAFQDAVLTTPVDIPPEFAIRSETPEQAQVEIIRGRLQALGPVTAAQLAAPLALDPGLVLRALRALEAEGFVLRGQFTGDVSGDTGGDIGGDTSEWCERRLLARIHRYTVKTLRAEIEPVSVQDFMRFLFQWHGIASDAKPEGPEALAATVAQLEGYAAAAASWETDILPARIHDYDLRDLDNLCQSGRVTWLRLAPPKATGERERSAGPVRATPMALLTRKHAALWRRAGRAATRDVSAPRSHAAQRVEEFLRVRGASFFDELVAGSGLLKSQVEEALGELVALGRINADSFSGLRALLIPAERRRNLARAGRRRRLAAFGIEEAGRWSLVPQDDADVARADGIGNDLDSDIETIARGLLRRYGVVFRRVLEREWDHLPPWYLLLRCYRRLEARGDIRGGRFVAGVSGEQFALPDAVGALRAIRKREPDHRFVSLSATDPLNFVGILTPGARVPAFAGNRVLFRDGVPIAVQVGGEAQFLTELATPEQWEARNALVRTHPLRSA